MRSVIPASLDADAANVMRQALAGMLWTKQFYYYDVDKWLEERGADPFKPNRPGAPRNEQWHHMYNADIISMPDKWEYPWYAAWDLAFHVLALTLVDEDFGKQQLDLMLQGQLPAPQRADSRLRVELRRRQSAGARLGDHLHLSAGEGATRPGRHRVARALVPQAAAQFTWWVNRKDRSGKNVFEGGFLGLDNIGVFDRSAPLPTGGYLEQADGTAWMALFCQNMLEIAVELAHDTTSLSSDMASQVHRAFPVDRFVDGPCRRRDIGMWDEEDGFFYDVLRLPDGQAQRLKVRSMVGLLPLCAVTVFEGELHMEVPGGHASACGGSSRRVRN